MGRGACVPSAASGARDPARRLGAVLGALCLFPALVLLAWPGTPTNGAGARAAQGDAAPQTSGVLASGSLGPPHPQAPRRRRYTLTPARLRWEHFNLTYKILSFPRNLLSPSETRRGLAAAFRMWSDVSPFSFREVAPEQPSDLRIGFYPINHTDCLVSPLHHCFDGPTGELAHAFFPPHGGIHFDDSEYWVLGPTRYSWKKGVWLTDLVHVAAHEIGHALGLMHSQHGRALMHLNATLRGWKALSQDELWGLHRLYGCLDRLFVCASWARRGFCDARRRLMKRLCPSSCDFCYEFPFPTVAATPPPPRTKTKLVPEGRNVTFRCGQKILHKKGKVYPPPSPQLVQGPGAPGVLLPRLSGPGRGAPEHHRQRHQRGHLHVCGAPAAARAQHLLLAHPRAELSAALRAEAADKALCLSSLLALSWDSGWLFLRPVGGEPAEQADH
ncbi:matrix metalloproteinase-23 isoform X1 [Muntiacus reevesi]|uniref:matrix metalloproteinase-23 isoform X1 n=1 Tax=Muntiacus reevesi TaxID=9886 RepID=UPI003307A717